MNKTISISLAAALAAGAAMTAAPQAASAQVLSVGLGVPFLGIGLGHPYWVAGPGAYPHYVVVRRKGVERLVASSDAVMPTQDSLYYASTTVPVAVVRYASEHSNAARKGNRMAVVSDGPSTRWALVDSWGRVVRYL